MDIHHTPILKHIDNNILVSETHFRLLGIEFGNRMTVIQLANRALLLHSPVRPSAELVNAIEQTGAVNWLIAPNLQHNLFSNAWKIYFPDARIAAPPGIKKISADVTLSTNETEPPLKSLLDDITIIPVQGIPALKESVFIHHESRSLILTDLAFNIQQPANLWSSLVFRLYGAHSNFGPTRLIRALIKDKSAFSQTLQTILEQDFERIIVSHGDIIETDGKLKFRQAFESWLR